MSKSKLFMIIKILVRTNKFLLGQYVHDKWRYWNKDKKVKILYGLEHVIIYIRCWKVNESKIFEYDNNHYN